MVILDQLIEIPTLDIFQVKPNVTRPVTYLLAREALTYVLTNAAANTWPGRVVIKNVFYVKNKQTCILSKKTRFFGFLCFFPPLGQWLIENRITAKYSSNSIRY